MSTENQPYHISTYRSGIQYDGNIEMVFSKDEGFVIDMHNGQFTSNDGDTGVAEKVKGEEMYYPEDSGLSGYKCILADFVNGDLVEIFGPVSNFALPGIIRVNGVIVLQSTSFPMRADYPLRWDVCEAKNFSEIAITDRRTTPYVFSVTDLKASVATSKYFTAFDPTLYQINLQSALDIVTFVELINVGGGGGLSVGQYQYQMRYASEAGDRTLWSQATPMIPVVQSLNSESRVHPWIKTYGGPPNPSSVTSFAPKLRFRVTNLYNYDYIEIKRISYNKGAGIGYTSNGEIVARIDVQPGEISVKEFIDPADSNVNIPLSPQDETLQIAHIASCGDIRYFDRRLVPMNVVLASRESDLTFEELNEKQGWPVIEKLNKAGHRDTHNHVYRKSEMRGEVAGFAVNIYDGVGNKGFAVKIPQLTSFQFPNRRDIPSAETLAYSPTGTVKAANNTVLSVSETHEVFDFTNAVRKENHCDFKNIIEKGRVFGVTGTKTQNSVTKDCAETEAEIESHGAGVNSGLVSVSYQPYTPVRQNDPDVEGHDYATNNKVAVGNINLGSAVTENDDVKSYRPFGFSPNYFSMGLAIAGVDNFPEWAKSFSIVRTESAKRVVCQGIGYYALTKGKFKFIGNQSLGGKELNKFWFYAPDLENGMLSSDMVNDIVNNPQNYNVQMVSPLGFFSEWFSGESSFGDFGGTGNPLAGQRDRCIDMISYARIIRDGADPNGNDQMNPGEVGTIGISGGDGWNYVNHDKYRNILHNSTFNTHPDRGNKLFTLAAVKRKAEGRGTYLELELTENVYAHTHVGGNSDSNFEDDGLRNWTEPLYIINIVRTGAVIRDNDMQKYRQTGHYQKLESIIGKSTGLPDQRFILVDERWEDCIPREGSTDTRYVYVKLTDGTIQPWINVSYKNSSQKAGITQNIGNNAVPEKGMYSHTNTNNRFYEIVFDQGFTPPEGSLIMVRYDKTAPIKIFGGDTYLSETIFAPIDGQSGAMDNAAETQFPLGIGLPYKDFKINPRQYTVRKAGASFNAVQDKSWFTLGFIRQLCVMATIETRGAFHIAHNLEAPLQFYPAVNYIMRPNRWDQDKNLKDNHIFNDYGDDYPNEMSMWRWGGFRFLQQINPDYSALPPIEFFSRPEFGFTEQLHYPTRVMWSLQRAINVQNAPGIKTFPANNHFDIDDDQGEIKRAWDATTSSGENLYAFCEKGVCLLLTKKSVLSDLNGGELAYMASADGLVKGQYWLSKEIGMPDELWRGAAEATVPMTMENGAEIQKEVMFFPGKSSIFRFMDNQLVDIGRIGYHRKLYRDGLKLIGSGMTTHIMGVYDRYTNQYYLHLQGNGVNKTFAFSQKNNFWFGTRDYQYDQVCTNGNETFGFRNGVTYKLHQGYTLNGQPVEMRVIGAAAPDQFVDKEFMRFRINCEPDRPTDINFLKTVGGVPQTKITTAQLKNYRGYEAWISRIFAHVDPARPRYQGRFAIFEIKHNLASEFKIIDSGTQYKKLKL